jgi:catechol 2,3-dioxygenase-like lactoylglutathione lyase family enzyme
MHVYSAVVIVNDQDAALDFYVNTLGWEVRQDNQMSPDYRFIAVAPPGHSTAIVLGPPHIHGRAAPTPDAPVDTDIYLLSNDVPADFERLSALGVVFTQEPEPMPWGGHGMRFSDVDGNLFFVSDAG